MRSKEIAFGSTVILAGATVLFAGAYAAKTVLEAVAQELKPDKEYCVEKEVRVVSHQDTSLGQIAIDHIRVKPGKYVASNEVDTTVLRPDEPQTTPYPENLVSEVNVVAVSSNHDILPGDRVVFNDAPLCSEVSWEITEAS